MDIYGLIEHRMITIKKNKILQKSNELLFLIQKCYVISCVSMEKCADLTDFRQSEFFTLYLHDKTQQVVAKGAGCLLKIKWVCSTDMLN